MYLNCVVVAEVDAELHSGKSDDLNFALPVPEGNSQKELEVELRLRVKNLQP